MDVLLTYDIATQTRSDEQRLRRVAATCQSYGLRIQNSVFECRLTNVGLEQLIGELNDTIDPAVDSVNLYRFPGRLDQVRQTLGRGPLTELGGPWIV